MDDMPGELAASPVGLVFLLIFLAGWLVYKLCAFILPPLWQLFCEACVAMGRGCVAIGRLLYRWWLDVTWKWRVAHAERQAIRQIDATRAEHVRVVARFAKALERRGG